LPQHAGVLASTDDRRSHTGNFVFVANSESRAGILQHTEHLAAE
jgi:hypothetical protein